MYRSFLEKLNEAQHERGQAIVRGVRITAAGNSVLSTRLKRAVVLRSVSTSDDTYLLSEASGRGEHGYKSRVSSVVWGVR